MPEARSGFRNHNRINHTAVAFNAVEASELSKTAASFLATHSLAARRTDEIMGMTFLRSPAWRVQLRVFEQMSMLRSPAWDAQSRIMQQTSMLRSAGWRAMQRAIERTAPLMSSPAYKRIARDTQFMATKVPAIHEWTRRAFPLLPTVEPPPRFVAETYEPSHKYAEVVPFRRRLAKIRIIRRHETQPDDGPQFPPDPDFGFRSGRW